MRTCVSQSMVRPHVCMGELFRRSPPLYLLCAHAAHQHPHMCLHAVRACLNASTQQAVLTCCVCGCARVFAHTHVYQTHAHMHTCVCTGLRVCVCVCVHATHKNLASNTHGTDMATTHATSHATCHSDHTHVRSIHHRVAYAKETGGQEHTTAHTSATGTASARGAQRQLGGGGGREGARQGSGGGREGRAGGKERWTERGRTTHRLKGRGKEWAGAAYQSSFTPEPIATQLLPR